MRTSRWLLAALVAATLATGCARRPPFTPSPELGAPEQAVALWPAPRYTKRLIEKAGLPTTAHVKDQYHIHAHLEVYKDGRQVVIPENIGIGDGVISPLHTHREAGVLHVENETPIDATLGQFFILWNVPLDGAKVVVDGVEIADPASHVLKNLQLITVYFGEPPAGH